MVGSILLSGGRGTRIGVDTPKQYVEVGDKPIISYSLKTLIDSKVIEFIRVVAEDEWCDRILKIIEELKGLGKFKGFSKAGINRQLSIYNALVDIESFCKEDDFILIHDAARPLLKQSQIEDIVRTSENHDGVIPILPAKDTMYLLDDKERISLVDRSKIFAGQAPELFKYGKYLKANEDLLEDISGDEYNKNMYNIEKISRKPVFKINGSTEPAILSGMDIVTIQGDEKNFKITTKEDLERFKTIVEKMEDKT